MDGEYLGTTTRAASRHAQPTALTAPRFWEIDALRGIAIVMTVLYHLIFDLDYFGGFDVDARSGFWHQFATTDVFLFIFLAGVSLGVSHDHARRVTSGASLFRKYLLRGLRIIGYGMLITLVIWLAVPDGQIYFGILHAIGLSIILAYPFLGRSNLALLTATPILLATPIVDSLRMDEPWLLWLGIRAPVGYMLDYRPMIPWFGVVLLGIFVAGYLYRDGERCFPWSIETPSTAARQLVTIGRHTLVIYLVHQPILLALLAALGIL